MGVGRKMRLSVSDPSCGGVWVRRVVLEVRLGRNEVDGWLTDRSITAIDSHIDLPRLTPATPPRSWRFPCLIAGMAQVSETRDQQGRVRTSSKLQALVYDILPPTTAIVDYAIGLEKLSANEQFFDDAQTAVSL